MLDWVAFVACHLTQVMRIWGLNFLFFGSSKSVTFRLKFQERSPGKVLIGHRPEVPAPAHGERCEECTRSVPGFEGMANGRKEPEPFCRRRPDEFSMAGILVKFGGPNRVGEVIELDVHHARDVEAFTFARWP
jgi:hypothetical protein